MYIYIIISIIVSLVIPIISTQIIKNAKLKKHTDKPLIMAASKFFSYTLLFINLFFCFCTVLISIYDDFGICFEIVMIVYICILSYFVYKVLEKK